MLACARGGNGCSVIRLFDSYPVKLKYFFSDMQKSCASFHKKKVYIEYKGRRIPNTHTHTHTHKEKHITL
jgi:hypothetical protein